MKDILKNNFINLINENLHWYLSNFTHFENYLPTSSRVYSTQYNIGYRIFICQIFSYKFHIKEEKKFLNDDEILPFLVRKTLENKKVMQYVIRHSKILKILSK